LRYTAFLGQCKITIFNLEIDLNNIKRLFSTKEGNCIARTCLLILLNLFVTSGTYMSHLCPTKSLFTSAGVTVSHFFSMLPSTLKYLYSVEPVIMHFPAKNIRLQMILCAMLHSCYAALHTVSFVHGCFAGKCILTGSTE
jgi:hypothetical protein